MGSLVDNEDSEINKDIRKLKETTIRMASKVEIDVTKGKKCFKPTYIGSLIDYEG